MTHRERELLQRLHDAGVILTVDGDRLRYRAPAGALTPELRAALEELKPELVYEYHERAGILEYDARLPREEAEVLAAGAVLAPPSKGTPGGCRRFPFSQRHAAKIYRNGEKWT